MSLRNMRQPCGSFPCDRRLLGHIAASVLWVHIGTLYQLNGARLKAWDDTLPLAQQPMAFVACHDALKSHLDQMQGRCEASRQEPGLHGAKRKVLSSLQNHWDGRTVFVERPEVAMDHNTAERALR